MQCILGQHRSCYACWAIGVLDLCFLVTNVNVCYMPDKICGIGLELSFLDAFFDLVAFTWSWNVRFQLSQSAWAALPDGRIEHQWKVSVILSCEVVAPYRSSARYILLVWSFLCFLRQYELLIDILIVYPYIISKNYHLFRTMFTKDRLWNNIVN